jgi:UDP:flavonoid glycosyltransferase YjiC (YdhE family)
MRSGDSRPPLSKSYQPKGSPRVAILIGATGIADPMAAQSAMALLDRGAQVALPRGIYEAFADRPGAFPFNFEEKDFLACDLALCRPGLGSIHDCIFYGLPMVLTHEIGNYELNYNGNRIEALGLGIRLGHLDTPGEIADRLLSFAQSHEPARILERMVDTQLNGIGQAAQWLNERLVQSH